jgi:PAS domain S-box-containing protein
MQSRWRAYLLAFGCVAVATALRIVLDPWLGRGVPYIMYYPAVTLAAWFGGFGPGVLATAASASITVSRHLYPLTAVAPADYFALAIFVGNSLIVAAIGEYLRRSFLDRQRLAWLIESIDDAVIANALDGTITSWNGGAVRLFGFTAADAIGRPIAIIVLPDRGAEEQRVLEQIRGGHRVEPFETTRRRKDGTLVEVSVAMSPIVDRVGAIVGASTIARDVSERRRVERQREDLIERERLAHEEMAAARNRLAFLADVGAVLSSSLDYEATLVRAVHLALPQLGDYCTVLVRDEHGVVRLVAWAHVVPEKESILHAIAARTVAASATLGFETFGDRVMQADRLLVVDHETLRREVAARTPTMPGDLAALGAQLEPYAFAGVPLHIRGRVAGVMAFGTTAQESRREYTPSDIELLEEFSGRVSLAIENARLFQHADELNRLKDEFLATLSHEMRTPLAAVLGWSRMLAAGQLDAERTTQAVEAIQRNAEAQSKIVDDILDVARGMAGNLRLEIAPIDLAIVARQGVEAIAPLATGKDVDLEVRAPAPVPMAGDAGRLQQVVWNLLTNAVKFTPTGGRVTIDVCVQDGTAELRVADTGVGIPAAFLPYVFDKFRQADGSFTREHGGLGLGLAITRHLIELHGGSIEAHSAGEGAGATFVVRLPRPAPRRSVSAGGVAHEVPHHDHREGHA